MEGVIRARAVLVGAAVPAQGGWAQGQLSLCSQEGGGVCLLVQGKEGL